MSEIRVLVVDDHPLFREGVVHTLKQEPDMIVVGKANNASQALELAREELPDIVLLDIKMPGQSGLTAAFALQKECPFSRILVLTVSEDEDTIIQALKAGARGYVLKGISGDDLVAAIRAIYTGETYISPSLASRLLVELHGPELPHPSVWGAGVELTERENSILHAIAQGLSNKEIASQLHLSEKTIKHYVTNILQKLQVRNRVEAAILALKKGVGQSDGL